MMSIHTTRKLLDRITHTPEPDVTEPTTMLGNWYATLLIAFFYVSRSRCGPRAVDGEPTRCR